MNTEAIYEKLSDLLISKEHFLANNHFVEKEIQRNQETEKIIFRVKNDCIMLMNITKHETLLEQSIEAFDPDDLPRIVKEAYQGIKDKLNQLEGKPISPIDAFLEIPEQKEHLFEQVKVFTPFNREKVGRYVFTNQTMDDDYSAKIQANTVESTPQMDEKQITHEVRKFLKMELKIGADFSRTKNGVDVARGDYIVLIEPYQQKVGFFSQLNLPKGTELHVTGSKPKNGKTYAVCAIHGKSYAIDVQHIKADYGQQYVRRYHNYPDLKKKVDSVILEKNNKGKGITMDSIQKMMQKHQETMPKNDQKLKYTM